MNNIKNYENILFGYSRMFSSQDEGMDYCTYLYEIYENGNLIIKENLHDKKAMIQNAIPIPSDAIKSIKKLLDEKQEEIDKYEENIDYGFTNRWYKSFILNGKKIIIRDIDYKDQIRLNEENPDYYRLYLPRTKQENRISRLESEILKILGRYDISLNNLDKQ